MRKLILSIVATLVLSFSVSGYAQSVNFNSNTIVKNDFNKVNNVDFCVVQESLQFGTCHRQAEGDVNAITECREQYLSDVAQNCKKRALTCEETAQAHKHLCNMEAYPKDQCEILYELSIQQCQLWEANSGLKEEENKMVHRVIQMGI